MAGMYDMADMSVKHLGIFIFYGMRQEPCHTLGSQFVRREGVWTGEPVLLLEA